MTQREIEDYVSNKIFPELKREVRYITRYHPPLMEEFLSRTLAELAEAMLSPHFHAAPNGSFKPWLNRVALNKFRDALRENSRNNRTTMLDDDLLSVLSADDEVASTEIEALWTAFDALSVNEKRVLNSLADTRSLVRELVYQQLADELGVKIESVRALKSSGMGKIKIALGLKLPPRKKEGTPT